MNNRRSSEQEYAYYLNIIEDTDQYNEKNIIKKIMSYQKSKTEQQKFILLTILINCFKIFELRGLKEPQLVKSQQKTQFTFIDPERKLQLIYHKVRNLSLDMIEKGIKEVLFIQSKKFKTSIQKEGITYIHQDQMIVPFIDQQILSLKVLDDLEIYQGVQYDNQAPIILYNDPMTIKLGAKVGQVIEIQQILPDKLPYVEISYRKVAHIQVKMKKVKDEDNDDDHEEDDDVVDQDSEDDDIGMKEQSFQSQLDETEAEKETDGEGDADEDESDAGEGDADGE